jgi:YesN/AraC family two-component response regulator
MPGKAGFITHTYLYKTIFFIVFISLLPLGTIGILTNYRMTEAMNVELIRANTRILTLITDTVESIINHVKNNCRIIKGEKTFADFQSLEKPVIWYEAKTEFNNNDELLVMYQYLYLKNKIFERLESEQLTNSFVNSVYYIDFTKNTVMTSRREIYSTDHFYDAGIFYHLDKQAGFWGMIERKAVDVLGLEKNVLTIYYGSRQFGDSQIFIMNLDTDGFYDYLNSNIFGESNNDNFFMVKNGEVILKSDVNKSLLDTNMLERLERANKLLPLSWKTMNRDKAYFVTALFSEQLYWWFISITNTSELLKTSNYIRKTIIAITIILMVLVLGSACIWSINWYKPIREMIVNIRRNMDEQELPSEPLKNELNIIEYGMQKIFTERDSLQDRLSRMLPFFKEKYLLGFLKGTKINHADPELPADVFLQPLLTEHLTVIMFKTDQYDAENENTPKESVAFLVYTMEIINSQVSLLTSHYAVLSDEFERIILVLNIDEEKRPAVFELCGEIREQITMIPKSQCFIGISRNHTDIDDLPEAFLEAQQALSYSVFFSDNRITYIEDIQVYTKPGKNRIFELPIAFFIAIRTGQGDKAVEQLLTYFRSGSIKDCGDARLRINNVFIFLLNKLFDLTEELNLDNDSMMQKLSRIYNDLLQGNEASALEEVKHYIRNLAAVYRDGIKTRNDNRVVQAERIINDEYTSAAISLTTVADKVNLNPDYLGRIFKENMGVSFVDYLTSLRIQKSIELLKTTNLHIKDISLTVGYQNPNYFIKVFKERIGLTPKEFKDNIPD